MTDRTSDHVLPLIKRLAARAALATLAALSIGTACGSAHALGGVVVDAATGLPIAHASVMGDGTWTLTNERGEFQLPQVSSLSARAAGYRRVTQASAPEGATTRVALPRFDPKALYLSAWGIGNAGLRDAALAVVQQTAANALVIDLKGDASIVPYPSAAWARAGLGAQSPVTVHDMAGVVASLHAQGLYLIARVVVFKDDRLADAHPEWAVHTATGAVWHDREDLAWIDPTRTQAWNFALDVAEEAARFGFDEVQFDYVRFPDATGLRFSAPDTEPIRVATITAFLDAARNRLAPFNVAVAADIFGYVCWNENDTSIGQQLEALIDHVDYLSPMLYPSGFSFGIPGYPQPVAAPYEIVHRTLKRALERTGVSALRFRPWLQAFRDYAFDRREFDADEIRAQINAAESLGTNGWMLWNAHNRYAAQGLGAEATSPAPAPAARPGESTR